MAEANPKRVRVAICDTNPDFVYYSEDDDEFEDNFSELDGSTPSVSSHDSDGESNVTSEFGSNTSLQMDQAETGDQPDYISKDGTDKGIFGKNTQQAIFNPIRNLYPFNTVHDCLPVAHLANLLKVYIYLSILARFASSRYASCYSLYICTRSFGPRYGGNLLLTIEI